MSTPSLSVGSKRTSGVVCGHMSTNYPRGRFPPNEFFYSTPYICLSTILCIVSLPKSFAIMLTAGPSFSTSLWANALTRALFSSAGHLSAAASSATNRSVYSFASLLKRSVRPLPFLWIVQGYRTESYQCSPVGASGRSANAALILPNFS